MAGQKLMSFLFLNIFSQQHLAAEYYQNDEKFENDSKNVKCQMNIWDFGGESLYYSTHQMFFTPLAIYVVVFNLGKFIFSFICHPCPIGMLFKSTDQQFHETTFINFKFWSNLDDELASEVEPSKEVDDDDDNSIYSQLPVYRWRIIIKQYNQYKLR